MGKRKQKRHQKEQEKSSDEFHLVFVYGSLKTGFGNSWHLVDSVKLDDGITEEARFQMISFGNFPAVIRNCGEQSILGELWKVDEKTLNDLDLLEGHPYLYQRQKTNITTLSSGIVFSAWMYTMDAPALEKYRATKDDNRVKVAQVNDRLLANWT
jgi:gamma-glutamylaminecyclotransferase